MLGLAFSARAAPPLRKPLTLQEPAWTGAARAVVTAEYRSLIARLQKLANDHQAGVPLRVSSSRPCILRLERGQELGAFVDASRGFLHQITWIDLRRGARLGAQAFGRSPGAGPAMSATCAWLEGGPGLAVSTEIIALKGADEPVQARVLLPEEYPRVCVANDVEPEEVAAPLRRLVKICGGRTEAIPVAIERPTTPKEMMLLAWDGRLLERVEELVHDGTEGAVLEPLARHPAAARFMVDHFRRSDRVLERKLAPLLAGLLAEEVSAGLLDEIFEAEAARRAGSSKGEKKDAGDAQTRTVDHVVNRVAGRPGFFGPVDAESVVEDVVTAARGWCAAPTRAKAGAAVLRKIIERTIGGERWNSSGAAMKALVCDCHEESAELLARFRTWAFAVPAIGSPLPTDLAARRAIEDLSAGRCDDQRRSAAPSNAGPLAAWDPGDRAQLRAFLLFAESVK